MSHPNASSQHESIRQERFERLATATPIVRESQSSALAGLAHDLRAIIFQRRLIQRLVRRELKARYKDSSLGFLWTLIRPLVSLLIYYLAIGQVLGAERAIPDFAIYVFAGLTTWTLFSTIVSGGTMSILANAGIIKKVNIPREIFPFSSTLAAVVDFASQLLILIIGASLIRGISVTRALIFGIPGFLLILIWGFAIALVFSALNVYFRDTQYLVEVALLLGFWLTPSVYSFAMVTEQAPSWLSEAFLWNPTALSVMAFQRAFWLSGEGAVWPDNMLERIGIGILIGLVALILSQRIFAHLQRNFAQEM